MYGIDTNSGGRRGNPGSRKWPIRYREVCIEHGLSRKYWTLYRYCVGAAGVLMVLWFAQVAVQIANNPLGQKLRELYSW